jgi:competence protein ComEA
MPSLAVRSILSVLLPLIVVCALSACAKRSYQVAKANDQHSQTVANSQRININTASAKELEDLPGIGKGLAERIIEHRDKYGPFRRAEHLIIVRGISDRRFRALRELITAE